jgi:hypothetical protein
LQKGSGEQPAKLGNVHDFESYNAMWLNIHILDKSNHPCGILKVQKLKERIGLPRSCLPHVKHVALRALFKAKCCNSKSTCPPATVEYLFHFWICAPRALRGSYMGETWVIPLLVHSRMIRDILPGFHEFLASV